METPVAELNADDSADHELSTNANWKKALAVVFLFKMFESQLMDIDFPIMSTYFANSNNGSKPCATPFDDDRIVFDYRLNLGCLVAALYYLTPIIGGTLGDACLTRDKYMTFGTVLFIPGLVFFHVHFTNNLCSITAQRLAGAMLVAIGLGLSRPNCIVIGAHEACDGGILKWYFPTLYMLSAVGEVLGYIILQLMWNIKTIFVVNIVAACCCLTLITIPIGYFNVRPRHGSTVGHLWRNVFTRGGFSRRLYEAAGAPIDTQSDIRAWRQVELMAYTVFVPFIIHVGSLLLTHDLFSYQLIHILQDDDLGRIVSHQTYLWITQSLAVIICLLAIVSMMRHGYSLSPVIRTRLGIIAMILSLGSAALITYFVIHSLKSASVAEAVAYFVLPCVLMGASEALAVVAGWEIAFIDAPHGLKSFVVGLFLTIWGFGGFIGYLALHAGLLQLFGKPEIPHRGDNFKHVNFHYLYIIIIGIESANLGLSFVIQKIYDRRVRSNSNIDRIANLQSF